MKKTFNYTLIFGGRYSVDLRIDTISEEYLEELRNTPKDELFYKMYDENYGDELQIYGISPHSGFIKVFNTTKDRSVDYDGSDKPIMTLHGEESGMIGLETLEQSPQPNSLIAACATSQDGIIGHIDLQLDAPFDPANLSVIHRTASKFSIGESAITGIKYKNGKETIEEWIDGTEYLNAEPKSEMFICLRFDKKLKATSLYEDKEWVD